jgi:alpha-ketoglutarate-dependent taurine dioxygenase
MEMLWECEVLTDTPKLAFDALHQGWQQSDKKVFVMRGGEISDPREFYSAHFDMLGTPVPLAEDATIGDRDHQRNGEIWSEVRYDPKHPDAYRHSANAQPLHTDGSYIPSFPNATLMACVANSGEGGETTFIDGVDVVTALAKEAPDLLKKLRSNILPHARSGDRRDAKVIDEEDNLPVMNWNYYCVDKETSIELKEIAQQYFDFLAGSKMILDHTLAVKLMPGDAITWKDRQVLHGRNSFKATQESERFLWKCAIDIGQFNA